jgi:hypothetical protein
VLIHYYFSSLASGERIKPLVSLEDVPQLVQTYFGFSVQTIRECNGYDDKNFYVEVIIKEFHKISLN